jgi:hypothetical protein
MTTIYGGSSFPIVLDSFQPSLVDNVDVVMADHVNTSFEAIEAIEAKIGITGGVATGFGGISFVAQSSNPGAGGDPTFWVDDSSGSPYLLIYTDDAGTDYDLTFATGTSYQLAVSNKTTNYNVLDADNNTLFTNNGATGTVILTLPTAAADKIYEFGVKTNQILRVQANTGDTIRQDGFVTAANGYFESDVVGNVIKLVAIDNTEWIITNIVGVWSIGP